MSKQGDDCYFYFYSTCNKGDSCSFRHCEAALGKERVCKLWQEGRCFRTTCRFRHMEVDKKRGEIPCYWENEPAGCQKSNCAFRHTKGRYVDGRFFPPSKKENLNFGIKTLEEIKLEKLKEKTKNQGEGPSGVSVPPLQSRAIPVPEKEIVRTVVRTVTLSTKQGEEPVIQLNLGERMGKRKASAAGKSVLPLKRNLADRLGKKTEALESADKAPKRVQVPRSLKERLGLPSEPTSRETEKAAKPAGEMHVKTVEEIRLESAHRRRGEPQVKPQTEGRRKTEDPSSGARPSPAVRVITFSGSLAVKKRKRLRRKKQKPEAFPTETKVESKPKKQSILAPSVLSQVRPAEPAGKAKPAGEVRVKTLEEMKREKALRMQQSGGKVPAPPAQPEPAPTGRSLLRITKLIAPGREEKMIVELSKPSPKAVSAPAEPSDQSATNSKVEVKSLEEIMWEKRQLKQRQEEKLQKEAAAVPSPIEQATKAKRKVCLKPLDGKATFPTKQPLKRKAAESHPSAVAAVKPLSATGGDGKEPSAKTAAVAVVPALPEDSLLSIRGREKPQAR
ncbi:zinc finger CCCH domain-containing protein 11A-like isoform X2 [Aquila chrysaetos chrysaetos]|uniref:zinc finger CCCH domain-containing protein 11A-like isoform X2 n=1 Tax=Aquila chrysaetos chrysaetos TaxID=223781 RepID=UPI00117703F4|nr:zinc finger CCCH domain-containing protein 11A-like isoform X2 [Aquila chrysaetos chrysaetos]